MTRQPPLADEPARELSPRPAPDQARVWRLLLNTTDDVYAALTARGYAIQAEIAAAMSRDAGDA